MMMIIVAVAVAVAVVVVVVVVVMLDIRYYRQLRDAATACSSGTRCAELGGGWST